MAGRTAPTAERPAQLNDRRWLQNRLAVASQTDIARELGVSRGTVDRARQRLNIPSQARGPRRGGQRDRASRGRRASDQPPIPAALQLIAERFSDDDGAPSETLLANRIVNVHHARSNHPDYLAALVELGSGVALLIEHQLTLRSRP